MAMKVLTTIIVTIISTKSFGQKNCVFPKWFTSTQDNREYTATGKGELVKYAVTEAEDKIWLKSLNLSTEDIRTFIKQKTDKIYPIPQIQSAVRQLFNWLVTSTVKQRITAHHCKQYLAKITVKPDALQLFSQNTDLFLEYLLLAITGQKNAVRSQISWISRISRKSSTFPNRSKNISEAYLFQPNELDPVSLELSAMVKEMSHKLESTYSDTLSIRTYYRYKKFLKRLSTDVSNFDIAFKLLSTTSSRERTPFLQELAKRGFPQASYILGLIFAPNDSKTSFHWFRTAADMGFAKANLKVAQAYHNGHGTAIDYEEALNFYKKDELLENPIAMTNRARILLQKDFPLNDVDQARKLLDKAVTLDHGPAMTLKAKLMYEGQLYEKDLKKTISLLEQAQKKDHPEAFAILRRIKKELKGEADYSKKNAP